MHNLLSHTRVKNTIEGSSSVFLPLLFLMCPIAFILFFAFLASAAWPILLVLLVVAIVGGVVRLAIRK